MILIYIIYISNFSYYYNKETGVTQWERPAEMGQAPLATGILNLYDRGRCITSLYTISSL